MAWWRSPESSNGGVPYCTICSVAKFIFSYRVGCRKKVNILGVSDVEKNRMLLFELEIICKAVEYLNHFLKCVIRTHLDSGLTYLLTYLPTTYYHGASATMGVAASPSWSPDLFIYLFIYSLHFIRPVLSSRAFLRSSLVQVKKVKIDIPNINNNSGQLALAARGYQIKLRRPSLVVIEVGRTVTKSEEDIFETFDMANHLPFRLCFYLTNNYSCKKFDSKREGYQWRIQRERFERGRIFKRYTSFEN